MQWKKSRCHVFRKANVIPVPLVFYCLPQSGKANQEIPLRIAPVSAGIVWRFRMPFHYGLRKPACKICLHFLSRFCAVFQLLFRPFRRFLFHRKRQYALRRHSPKRLRQSAPVNVVVGIGGFRIRRLFIVADAPVLYACRCSARGFLFLSRQPATFSLMPIKKAPLW